MWPSGATLPQRSGGLCTLVGVILYISSITGEVGNKPQASIEEPKFIYDYGSSFFMAVGSFILTELSGVLSVYLYISKYKQSQRAKHLMLKSSEPQYHHPPHHQYHHHTSSGGHQHHHVYHHHNDRNHQSAALSGGRHIRRAPRENSSDRSLSRDRSRDPSATRSESYFTYTPISDDTPSSSHELSSYAFPRDSSTNNTISTTAEMHGPGTASNNTKDGNHVGVGNTSLGNANATNLRSTSPSRTLVPSTSCGGLRTGSPPSMVGVPSIDIVRRTTPV
ncbi:voltage-dependent calcium channel gamma-5 subunit [Elysia marginata]|uniref:Voltage-dependent calcium channel gamma-5 subunit n=1 Tax=Elysia marginata TaxID=1093978 RepID=A0AAV4HW19_9GAST|nr:voltage-dependent calcium channel gamma-5 subunit [Elysia marginata]